MARILVVGDPHLTDNQNDEYRHEFMGEHLPEYVRRVRPDGLVILGDLTEEKDRHRGALVNRVCQYIDRLAQWTAVACLMGNHDYANEGSPFFDFLHMLPSVTFINRVTDGSDMSKTFRFAFKGCLFLPHTRNYERDWEAYNLKDYDHVFAHNTFDGAGSGTGHKLKGIPLERVAGAKVWCGDVHKPHATGPVAYVGAPYRIDFGDDWQPRMLSLDGDAYEWVMLDKYPQKILVECREGEDLEDHKDAFRERDLLKVRVEVDDMKGWTEIKDVVHRQAAKLGARVLRVEPVVMGRAKRRTVKVSSESSSDSDIVRDFADRHQLDDGTLGIGLRLLEE